MCIRDRFYRRIIAILQLHQGRSCSEVAEMLQVSKRAVEYWRKKFLLKGVAGIRPLAKGKSRSSRLSKDQKDRLYNIVVAGPEKSGYSTAVWTCSMIRDEIKKRFNVSYHPNYVSSILKSIGLSWKKCSGVGDGRDPKQRVEWLSKKWPAFLKQARENRGCLLFEDEVSFDRYNNLSYTWGPVNEKIAVKTTCLLYTSPSPRDRG